VGDRPTPGSASPGDTPRRRAREHAGDAKVPTQGTSAGLEASVYALAAVVDQGDRPTSAGPLRTRQAGPGRRPGSARLRRGDYGAPLQPLVTPVWRRTFTAALVWLDLAVAAGSAQVGLSLTGGPASGSASAWSASAGLAPAGFAAAFVAVLALGRVYEHRFVEHGGQEFRRLVTGVVVVLAASGVLVALAGETARGLVLFAAPAAGLGCLVSHLLARQLLTSLRTRGRCGHRVLLIGLERSVAELARTLASAPGAGMRPVATCINRSGPAAVEGLPVLGTPAEAVAAITASGADTVLLTAWSDVSEKDLRRLAWALEGSRVQLIVAPRLAEVAVPRLDLRTVAGQALLMVHEPEFTGVRRVAKGALDHLIALTALLLLGPVMIAVATAVKLTSPGPVLFRQERVGKRGTTFRMTKFRSMYVDAEQRLAELADSNEHGGGPLFKMKQDPRVTPVGRFIRRFSLDELPQLFDVLARTMSVVGPRPPLPREVATYEKDVHRRLLVKPGITGLWQVSGRSDLSWEESVRLDLSYVENWSLGLDLSIIARTVAAVLASRGAY
jgi:exopolysaccharide biosynthesis polyprenyl glycosylphosphotransferase